MRTRSGLFYDTATNGVSLRSIWLQCYADIDIAGYSYRKREVLRQYLVQDIEYREQEVLSFLRRIDADLPGAVNDFALYKSATAMELKKYTKVSYTKQL